MSLTPKEYLEDPGWQYLRESDEQRIKNASKPYDSKVTLRSLLSELVRFVIDAHQESAEILCPPG